MGLNPQTGRREPPISKSKLRPESALALVVLPAGRVAQALPGRRQRLGCWGLLRIDGAASRKTSSSDLPDEQLDELLSLDGLALEQDLRGHVELVAAVLQHLAGGLVGVLHNAAGLVVDLTCDLVRVRLAGRRAGSATRRCTTVPLSTQLEQASRLSDRAAPRRDQLACGLDRRSSAHSRRATFRPAAGAVAGRGW